MKYLARISTLVLVAIVLSQPVKSQELNDYLSRYVGEEAEGYLQPFANALGADLNTGWYRSAYIKKNGFSLTFMINAQMALVPENQKTFTTTTPDFFSPRRTFEAPTIFGPEASVRVQGDAGTAYNAPGGANLGYLPFGIPQVTIGNVFGTQASFRFFAIDFSGDIGRVNVFGWGIRHSVSQYFEDFPVDLAVGYYSNSFQVGEYVDANTQFYSLQAGYHISVLEIYGGLGYESADVGISYESEDVDGKVDVDLKGENDIRFTVGAGVNLGAFRLNADYSFAKMSTFNAGIGLGFGNKRKSGF